jgi:hypothetical protein
MPYELMRTGWISREALWISAPLIYCIYFGYSAYRLDHFSLSSSFSYFVSFSSRWMRLDFNRRSRIWGVTLVEWTSAYFLGKKWLKVAGMMGYGQAADGFFGAYSRSWGMLICWPRAAKVVRSLNFTIKIRAYTKVYSIITIKLLSIAW